MTLLVFFFFFLPPGTDFYVIFRVFTVDRRFDLFLCPYLEEESYFGYFTVEIFSETFIFNCMKIKIKFSLFSMVFRD